MSQTLDKIDFFCYYPPINAEPCLKHAWLVPSTHTGEPNMVSSVSMRPYTRSNRDYGLALALVAELEHDVVRQRGEADNQ